MGMYTELVIKCMLFARKPEIIENILKYLFDSKSDLPIPKILPDHQFFKCERWSKLGKCNSYYHIPCSLNFYNGEYLFSRSDINNYDNEIEKFLDWIDPYLIRRKGNFIGWIFYEEWEEPKYIYIK